MAKKQVTITVDGKECVATFLGKGQYSRVYKCGDRAVMYTKGDCAKEVLAMYQYERNAHLPELIRHDNIKTSRGEYWYVFSSPIYKNVTKKYTPRAYTLMKKMITYYNKNYYGYYQQRLRGIYQMQAFLVGMKESKEFPYSVIKALNILIDNAANCGDKIIFDIHKRNFGVNEYGTLIFRDIIAVQQYI